MNGRQLADRIGNIDDRLIQQAQETGQKKTQRPPKLRRWAAAAAVVALMGASFGLGALAFAKETVVEVEVPVEVKVPVDQETVELKDIGITLILPDDWKGRYGVEQTWSDNHYRVYSTEVREAFGRWSGVEDEGGMLFYILKWNQQLTEEEWRDPYGEWNYARNRYIMATKDGTYLLYYASDVQFTPETEEEYRQMEGEIDQIRFVADGALLEPSVTYHGENHELLASDVKLDEDGLALLRQAAAALAQGEGQPVPAPQSDYFSVSVSEAGNACLLYQKDGKSYLWREGRALPLTQPLFDRLYQGITEQAYAEGQKVKWQLREENGKQMLISRFLSGDIKDIRRWYEETFSIGEREEQRYVYMGEDALVSLVDDGTPQQGLAMLLPETMAVGDKLYACCLLGFFTIEGDELRVDSVKAQLIRCDLRAPDAITGMTSDQLEFDKPVGEQDLPSRLAPEIGDYCFSEAEAHRLVDDLLEQVFPECF